ncbi:hypothetical protein AcetOrient_orf04256 [Acetobacter orientalis]|uniref:Uncharacterized protein n=1 Tax=Acetobacter orientalis TaxID=146474 RepID=A0A2Z5ZL44_9PROT|nr:hypothetical protein AcetOrient_orf04256 [Acetobacter orientalis]
MAIQNGLTEHFEDYITPQNEKPVFTNTLENTFPLHDNPCIFQNKTSRL